MKHFLLALVCAASTSGQERVELNAISKVEVKDGAVEIQGSRKPSYTTFTQPSPPRLVIDIFEATVQGVPAEQAVGRAGIVGVRTATFGSATSSVARVLIGLEKAIDYDVVPEGNRLIVRPLVRGARPPVAKVDPVKTTPPVELAQARVEGETQARLEAESRAKEQEKARLEADRARAEAEARSQKDTEARLRAEADARARGESEARLRAEADARARAEQESRARAEAESRARAAAEAKAQAEAKGKQDAEAKAQAEAKA